MSRYFQAQTGLHFFIFVHFMEDKKQVSILKSDGSQVVFDRDKLIRALKNSGASQKQSQDIANEVEKKIYDGISTRKIYQHAYRLLKKASHRTAGRYRLKKAIQEMGPSGYPFEIFVGKLFKSFGYQVEIGKQMHGKCIQHEVDVVARKKDEIIIAECKFHSDQRAKTNVQVPLYIHSRFNDIEAKWRESNADDTTKIRGFVVTNTRFTKDAIGFSECAGLGLISWDFPEQNSLKHYIDLSGLHPVTSLHSLNKSQKKIILDEGIVLCRDLMRKPEIMRRHSFNEKLISKVLKEARLLVD